MTPAAEPARQTVSSPQDGRGWGAGIVWAVRPGATC